MPDIVVTIIDVVAGPSIFVDVLSNTGWWFGTFFLVSHILGTIISITTNQNMSIGIVMVPEKDAKDGVLDEENYCCISESRFFGP